MEDLFRSYWWLLFPLGWFVTSTFSSFLNYRRQRETLRMIRAYAERGQEPPEALLKVLDRPIDSDTEFWNGAGQGGSKDDNPWFMVVLFGALGAGFGYAAWADLFGAGEAFIIVCFVMGAIALAYLVSALGLGRRRRD